MISCKHATELISKSLEEQLSWQEQLSLKIHLFICETCEQFRKHSLIVRAALRRKSDETSLSLSTEAKEKIRSAIRSKDSQSS